MAYFRNHYSLLPPVIKILLLSNGLIYIIEILFANTIISNFALWPYVPDALRTQGNEIYSFMPWQLLSYGFLHGGLTHLLLNMYALWIFGVQLENLWGSRVFAIYYFVCVIGAGLIQLLVTSFTIHQGLYYPTIGASGGVFGVLLAFGMFFPNQVLFLLIPPMPIKAKWFVILYGLIELGFGITGTSAGIAHFAHLGGMLFGFLLIYYWTRHPPKRVN
jgi:membrane associated rhomboid family serine protease